MKIQRFSGIQREFQFFPTESFELFEKRFYQNDLGKLYSAVPWAELVKDFGISEKTIGRPFDFPAQGRSALMFLKNYSSLSDKKLIEPPTYYESEIRYPTDVKLLWEGCRMEL